MIPAALVIAEIKVEWAMSCELGLRPALDEADVRWHATQAALMDCGPHRVVSRHVFTTQWQET